MEPVAEDRTLVDGDWAQITFRGEFQGEAQTEAPQAPVTGDDVMIEVGGQNTLPAFNEALRGSKPGQELKFEVTYPEDFGERSLAGKTVSYDVEVKAIKKKIQPELIDDFATAMTVLRRLHDYWSALPRGRSGAPLRAAFDPAAIGFCLPHVGLAEIEKHRRLEHEAVVSSSAAAIRNATHVVLPGVGAAADAMNRLLSSGSEGQPASGPYPEVRN